MYQILQVIFIIFEFKCDCASKISSTITMVYWLFVSAVHTLIIHMKVDVNTKYLKSKRVILYHIILKKIELVYLIADIQRQ